MRVTVYGTFRFTNMYKLFMQVDKFLLRLINLRC